MDETIRILIVDDDENIRKVLTTILADEGYVVETANTAKKAIEITRAKFCNLALMDIRLPDMEGTELLTRIKETTPRMRRIIITGYPTLQNAIEAVNKKADAYIMKPFQVEEVLQTIKNQLQKQEEEKKYGQEKVAAFIETRVRELEKESACRKTV